MASKTVSIFVNVKGNAQKALKGIGAQLGKNQKQVKKSALSWKGLAVSISAMVVLKKANAWMKESMRLAQVQERAEKRLSAVYGKNIDSLKKYASALQLKTTFGDEEILLAQSKLAVFVKEEDQLKALTKATLDFAVVTGMDLDSAFALVGKSVGSSTNALTRYGIEVKGAVGSVERINSAVGNMNKLFKGAAEADAFTNAGKIEQTENAIGDLREEVGEELLPALVNVKQAQLDFYSIILKNKGGVVRSVTAISNAIIGAIFYFDEWINRVDGTTTSMEQNEAATEATIKNITRMKNLRKVEEAQLKRLELRLGRRIDLTRSDRIQTGKLRIEAERLTQSIDKQSKNIRIQQKAAGILVDKRKVLIADAKEEELVTEGASKATTEAAKKAADAWQKSFDKRYQAKIDFLQADEDLEAKWAGIAEENKKTRDEKAAADAQTRRQTIIDIAAQTAQGVQMVMSAVSNKRQQDHDNEVRLQKEAVQNSRMSAKQKEKALAKIKKDAAKERLKLRLAEWRQNMLMGAAGIALAMIKSMPNPAKIAATAVMGGIQMGIMGANRPKFYNGTDEVHSKTGMLGDVIPAMLREGEKVSTPAQQKAENKGGGGAFNYSPQISFPAEATDNAKSTFKAMLNDHARDIEDMFVNNTINPTKINGALAV